MQLIQNHRQIDPLKHWWRAGFFGCFVALHLHAAPAKNQIVADDVRFTVITTNCIRIEQAAGGKFTDEPTLFVANRDWPPVTFRKEWKGKTLTLDNSGLRLTYHADGNSLNPDNLKVEIKTSHQQIVWFPGKTNQNNLKGPLATLDGVSGPVPLPEGLLSRDGWHLIDDTGKPILVDGWIKSRPADRGTDWYLFGYGDEYRAALKSLAIVSGPSPLPRREIFGSWYCRWWDYTEQDYYDLVRSYHEHGFPLDILVMDMGWHTQEEAKTGIGHAWTLGWTGWTWNRKLLPSAERLLADLNADGLKVVLNAHPHDGVRAHETAYPEFMRLLGKDPVKDPVPKFDAGNREYMNAYFRAAHWPLEDEGVDFWWVDWQQDDKPGLAWVPGVPGLRHLPWLNTLYFENSQRDGKRGLGFSRWGGWGDQKHPIQFSGDTEGTWDMLRFEIEFTQRSGNSGCFYWAHDIGGFSKGNDPELFARWIQFGAMSAALRLHSVIDPKLDRRPWLWGEEVEHSALIAYQLRSQLLPYIYSSARQCLTGMVPLLRPLYLDYPREEYAYTNYQEYFLGDNLLVAPVTQPRTGPDNLAMQEIQVPPGNWFHWFTGKKFEGPGRTKLQSTLDDFPLLVRGGVPIPLQPVTQRMTKDPIQHLTIRCWPGQENQIHASQLYEDDGKSEDYLHGNFATTSISYAKAGGKTIITVEPTVGSYEGQPAKRQINFELASISPAGKATLNKIPVKVEYDGKESLVRFDCGNIDIRKRQTFIWSPCN